MISILECMLWGTAVSSYVQNQYVCKCFCDCSFFSMDVLFRFWMSGYFFKIRCCNQFRLPVCTTEDAVHTKRLNVSQLVLLFSAHLRFCFCSSINVQILLSLSPHYSEFLVHVWCALFDLVQKAERVQSLPVGCACISLCGTCGHVHYILEKKYAVTQKRKAVKIKTCKRHRLGAKVQSSLRGARFRKGIVGIRTCAEMCTCNRIR